MYGLATGFAQIELCNEGYPQQQYEPDSREQALLIAAEYLLKGNDYTAPLWRNFIDGLPDWAEMENMARSLRCPVIIH